MTRAAMTTNALFNYYGSNRTLAPAVGEELKGCTWVGIIFAGGMPELPYINARTILVNDLHQHSINAARVLADKELGAELIDRLAVLPFCEAVLQGAQLNCIARQEAGRFGLFGQAKAPMVTAPDLDWAVDYFICTWMGRGGKGGTDGEFTQGISFRWNANGGDSATRFRSMTRSLPAWQEVVCRDGVNFSSLDCFEFLGNVADVPSTGIYSDAPWPGPGDDYSHKFDDRMQRALAKKLASYRNARVVIRFGDHPLIRELYPEPEWNWRRLTSRNQANDDCAEVLILNGPSLARGSAGVDGKFIALKNG